MNKLNHFSRRSAIGHTLLEMLLSLVLLSIVMASVGSAVMFASQAIPDEDSPVATLIQDSAALSRIAEHIAMAKHVPERSTNAVTIVVDDHTGDGLPDRIRYAWSGTSGDPLTVALNGGSPTNLIESLDQLQFGYDLVSRTVSVPAPVNMASAILIASSDDISGGYEYDVKPDDHAGQLTTPTLASGATSFTPTRIEFYVEPQGSDDGVVSVEVRNSDAGDPGTILYGSGQLIEADLANSYNWVSVDLSNTALVAEGQAITIVAGYDSGSNSGIRFKVSTNGGGTMLTSSDGGASWSQDTSASLCYRLYGTLDMAQTNTFADQDVTREHIEAIDIQLQSTAVGRSPMRRTVRLEQAPEVLTQFWEADFTVSPTGYDLNDDGTADWRYDGTDTAIPNEQLSDGFWSAKKYLAARPTALLADVVRVEARIRAGSGDAVIIYGPFHSDGSGNVMPLVTILEEDGSGGQELVFFNEQVPTTPIATITGISDGWVDVQLTLLPDEQMFSVRVNGVEEGTAGLAWETDQGARRFWIEGTGNGATVNNLRYTFGGSYVESSTDVPDNALGGAAGGSSGGSGDSGSGGWGDFLNNLFGS